MSSMGGMAAPDCAPAQATVASASAKASSREAAKRMEKTIPESHCPWLAFVSSTGAPNQIAVWDSSSTVTILRGWLIRQEFIAG